MNTATKALRRNYEKLTDLERFRLVVAAMARDDDSEVEALARTAPKATYKMTAWPYRGMIEGLHKAAWCVITDLLDAAQIMTLEWGLKWAYEYRAAVAGDDGLVNDDPDDDGDFAPPAVADLAELVLARWDGLALFCQDLEITREQALRHAPRPAGLDVALSLAQAILDFDADLRRLFTEIHCDKTGQDPAEIDAQRAATVAERRAELARSYADSLREVFDHEAGEV